MNHQDLKTFWLVWNRQGSSPVVMHDSEESAMKEAERLALANKGQCFHVLQATWSCRSDQVIWTERKKP